jgi:anti-sigma factor RsiW
MHEEWVRQIDLELDGELSLPERAALARHLSGCRHCAEARVSHLEMRVAFARSAGAAAGWLAHWRWGGPGAGALEATRATLVAQ